MSQDALAFLSAANPDYIASLYANFRKDPATVDESWAALFGGLGNEAQLMLAKLQGASWTPAPEKLAAVLSTPANESEPVKAAKKDDKKATALATTPPAVVSTAAAADS